MIVYRHADPRFPFLWETGGQPPARWHGPGEGPVHYFAETPDGAWAEFLRHEEISDPADLEGVSRSIWAIQVPDPPRVRPRLEWTVLTGDATSYEECQAEARRIRGRGATGLRAPSAALLPGGASGFRTDARAAARPPADRGRDRAVRQEAGSRGLGGLRRGASAG